MSYFLDLFSPETFEVFSRSDMSISGFRKSQESEAINIHPGDKLLCYMTVFSRWVGILEVKSDYFEDDKPIFFEKDDPFVIRFKVSPIVWLPRDKTIPIKDDTLWTRLSFTKNHNKKSTKWTGKLRASLREIDLPDAQLIEKLLISQNSKSTLFPIEDANYKNSFSQRIKRPDKSVKVTVPKEPLLADQPAPRQSYKIQALIAKIGQEMGYRIWIPKRDRLAINKQFKFKENVILEHLPFSYDDTTIKTIEEIDVIWVKGRSIARAFEVEHTTLIYSGILRMADLMALQPDINIKIHIVAPSSRKDKVFEEIQRPIFSLIERGPLSDYCTFISYESVIELSTEKHLDSLSDRVLDKYAEHPE